MITWCDLSYLKITSDTEPHTAVRLPLPSDTEEEKKEKKKKPYLNKKRIMFNIDYLGFQYCFVIEKGYTWDGASIPFGFRWIIGAKGSNEFLNPSMVHDKMCEHPEIVGYDRQLSSIIFRELLLASGVRKLKAEIMYLAVDNFQKLSKKWERK